MGVGTTAMHGFGILVLILPLCLSAPADVRTVVVTAPVEIVTVTQVGTQIYSATSLEAPTSSLAESFTSSAKTTSLESSLSTSLESSLSTSLSTSSSPTSLPLAAHTIIPCLKSGKGFGETESGTITTPTVMTAIHYLFCGQWRCWERRLSKPAMFLVLK